jgi:phage terminase Nu1 subunit (DNA packaging protein)
MLTAVRAGLLAVPRRLAETSRHLTVQDVDGIDREIRAALAALADEAVNDDVEKSNS